MTMSETLNKIIDEIKHFRAKGYTGFEGLVIELESIIEDYEAEKERNNGI